MLKTIIIDLNIIGLREIIIKPYGCDKMYMDKHWIEEKLYQLIDQSNERKINHRGFPFILFGSTYLFCDKNGRTYYLICLQFQLGFLILTRLEV